MSDYLQFLVCLGLGIFGICLVLSTLFDSLFVDWDIAADWRNFKARARRQRYVTLEERSLGREQLATRWK